GRCPAGQAHSALLPLPPLPLFWRLPALAAVSANLIDSVVDFKLREFTVGAGSSVVEPTASAKDLIEILRKFSDCSSFGSDIFGELQRLASLPRSKAPRRSMASRRWGTGIDSSSKISETASLDGVKPVVRACVRGGPRVTGGSTSGRWLGHQEQSRCWFRCCVAQTRQRKRAR
ncbi:unnamed protein product, partial [Musa acuminata subsp. burmannicoides]